MELLSAAAMKRCYDQAYSSSSNTLGPLEGSIHCRKTDLHCIGIRTDRKTRSIIFKILAVRFLLSSTKWSSYVSNPNYYSTCLHYPVNLVGDRTFREDSIQ